MNVLFFFSIQHKLFNRLALAMRRDDPGVSFSGVVYGNDQLRYLREAGFPGDDLNVFTRDVGSAKSSGEDFGPPLADWEDRHGANLSLMISADRRFARMPRTETLRLAGLSVRWLEEILDRTRPDVIISEGIDCLLSYLLYTMAKSRDIQFHIPYAAPTPGRVAVYGNPDNHWDQVQARFAEIKAGDFSAEQRARAEAFLDDFRTKRSVPTYMSNGITRIFSWKRDLRAITQAARRNMADPSHPYDPSYEGGVAGLVGRRLRRFARARVASRRVFETPVEGENFVFFPLQLEPECSTLVFAPHYADQAYVVEALAKSLPIDHVLYVKEHPAMVGRRPLSFYKRARSVTNVRLISPGVHSHGLINKASAVVTATSTVGWEAVLYEKPVVVLGNVWYDAFDLVYRPDSVHDLARVLKTAIGGPPPDRDILLKFIAAVQEGTYPGEMDNPDYNPDILSEENVRRIAFALRSSILKAENGSRDLAANR